MNGFFGTLPFDCELLANARERTRAQRLRQLQEPARYSTGLVSVAELQLQTESHTQVFTDDDLVICADARIDARSELCRQLNLPSREELLDAELILRAYQRWGTHCLDRLMGDFSFAIWDGNENLLFCGRDHMGVKPFFYATAEGEFVFSNRLQRLRELSLLNCRPNDLAIVDFLLFGYGQSLDPELTAVHPVRRLLAGHALIVRFVDSATPEVRTWKYWSAPEAHGSASRTGEEYAEELKSILKLAVRDRLRGCTRAGVLMSGGLDSTSIAALARREADCEAYTVVYDKLIADEERQFAKIATDALQIAVHFYPADNYRLFERWSESQFQPGEPHEAVLSAINADVFKKASLQSGVLLSGSGGDPLFRRPQGYWKASLKDSGLLTTMQRIGDYGRWMERLPRLGLRTALRTALVKSKERQLPEFPTWIDPDLEQQLQLRKRWREWHERERKPSSSSLSQVIQHPFWGCDFEFHDPGVSRIPVEARYPLFDLRVIRFLLSLPDGPWSFEKILLRLAMKDELPDRVRLRPKTPLKGDPVRARLRRESQLFERWKFGPGLRRYVDCNHLPTGPAWGRNVSLDLRPFCLDYWLKNLGFGETN